MVFGFGLTSTGLDDHEAAFALSARAMQESRTWVKADPPLLSWMQVGVADVLRRETGAFELRLSLALAAWVGVMATYALARRLLVEPGADPRQRAFGDLAAWWSGLLLLTGFIVVRAARVADVDVLLIAPTVIGVGALHAGWRSHIRRNAVSWGAVVLAVAAAAACTLAAGPFGGATMLIGGGAGVLLLHLSGKERPGGDRRGGLMQAMMRCGFAPAVLTPIAVVWLWGRAAGEPVGVGLDVSIGAPFGAMAALSWGVGLASLTAVIGAVWMVLERPRAPAGWLVIAAWIIAPVAASALIAVSVEAMAPAIAMFGGLWAALVARERSWGGLVQRGLYVGVIVLAGVFTWWYGFGRARRTADENPRAFVRELLRPELAVQAQRIGSLDFASAALDFHVGHEVVPIVDRRPEMEHASAVSLDALVRQLQRHDAMVTLLIQSPDTSRDRLLASGLAVETIPLNASYVVNGEAVHAVRVWAP